MKILVISYHYLPEENPRVFRWSSIVSHWLSSGHDVSVITATQNNFKEYKKDSSQTIIITENLIGKYIRQFSLEKYPKLIKKCIRLFNEIFIKSIRWPDFSWPWILNARRRALRHLKENQDTDIIISVSHPFSSHLIGNAVKKKYPKIRWIMDIGDPFCFLYDTQPNNFLFYNKLNKYIERKFFSRSNFISVTTKETMDEYSKLFPESKAKIKVIPPLISPESKNFFNNYENKSQLNNKKLRFVYIGTLYAGIRHPKKLLDMLSDVRKYLKSNFEIHFYGPVVDIDISTFNNSYIYFHSSVCHYEALQLMMEADILINIGNTTKFQFPSKLVEYVSTGKPVLNIISNSDDSSLDFLSNYPLSKSIYLSDENKNNVVSEVTDYIKFTLTRRKKVNHVDMSKYEIQNIASQYELMFF